MKKILLAVVSTASMAIMDDNIATYGYISNKGSQVGIEYLSEGEHRLGTHQWKFGMVYDLGVSIISNGIMPTLMVGSRVEFDNNQAFVLGMKVEGINSLMFGFDTESHVAYQRRLSKQRQDWIEFSVSSGVAGNSYAVGLKRFYYSYE